MEFSDLGKHCRFCNRQDFLPFKCNDCHNYFCKEHWKDHNCVTKKMCPENFKRNISLFKIFGSGTIILYVMFLSYYLWSKNKS